MSRGEVKLSKWSPTIAAKFFVHTGCDHYLLGKYYNTMILLYRYRMLDKKPILALILCAKVWLLGILGKPDATNGFRHSQWRFRHLTCLNHFQPHDSAVFCSAMCSKLFQYSNKAVQGKYGDANLLRDMRLLRLCIMRCIGGEVAIWSNCCCSVG